MVVVAVVVVVVAVVVVVRGSSVRWGVVSLRVETWRSGKSHRRVPPISRRGVGGVLRHPGLHAPGEPGLVPHAYLSHRRRCRRPSVGAVCLGGLYIGWWTGLVSSPRPV